MNDFFKATKVPKSYYLPTRVHILHNSSSSSYYYYNAAKYDNKKEDARQRTQPMEQRSGTSKDMLNINKPEVN